MHEARIFMQAQGATTRIPASSFSVGTDGHKEAGMHMETGAKIQ